MQELWEDLRRLCPVAGVAGAETGAAAVAAELLRELAPDARADAFGNVTGTVACGRAGAKTLLLDAHIDEIGLIVTAIDEKGFLRVSNCGGVDRRLLSAQYVTVHTKDGPLPGVVGSKPPHLESAEDAKKVPELKEMFVDVGLPKEKAEARVALGDRITIESGLVELANGRVSSKALDDRAGVAVILHALRLVRGKELPVNLAVQFTGREETGGQGATIAGFALEPDSAVAVDVSAATIPGISAEEAAKLGGGVMIGISPALDRAYSARMQSLAKAAAIPFQLEVMGGRGTGTNADEIGVTRAGVRCALLSIPVRYMHTPVELVELADLEATARLLSEFIEKGGEDNA